MTEFGRLDVVIDGESRFAQHTLPYTVRDSHLAVVHEGRVGDEPLELNRGLYSVDLLTHTGLPATSVVMITPDVTTHIRIAPSGNVSVISGDLPTSPVREIFTSNDLPFAGHGLEIAGSPRFELAAGSTTTPTLEVADTWNCEIRAFLPSGAIVIEPTDAYPKDVPGALFRLGEDFMSLSLPLNPSGTRPELRACIVTAVRNHGKDRIRVWFPAARELCVMMDGLLRSNTASSAIEIFQAATHLITDDDRDPAGAALGGLTLHRLGRLSQPDGWGENLATNYSWLPDGQILWAAQLMLSSRAKDRRLGLDLLLSATRRRPLYSDGLALAIELLRRWPDAEHPEARAQRLGLLTARWSETDWDATNLTLVPPLLERERVDNIAVATRIVDSTDAAETDFLGATLASRGIDTALEAVLSKAGIFQGVDADGVSALLAQLQPVHFPDRHTVFAEGEPGDALFIIVSGKVAIGRRSADGREHLLAIMGASDMFGELAVFDPGPRTATATTITEVDAVSMDGEALRAWITGRPEIAEQLLRVLARRLRRTNDNLADLIFTDVPGRVAKQLLTLAGRFGTRQGGAIRVTHDLTQEEIARLVGASRETVNKALAEFAQRGWIRLEGKSFVISSTEGLNDRAR